MYLHQSSTAAEIITYAKSAKIEFRLRVVILGKPEYENLLRLFGRNEVEGVKFRMKEK